VINWIIKIVSVHNNASTNKNGNRLKNCAAIFASANMAQHFQQVTLYGSLRPT
jgi:hypothetical protein